MTNDKSQMKKIIKIICLLCTLYSVLCTSSFAQEEGVIKRMWKKIKGQGETAVEEKKEIKKEPLKKPYKPTKAEMIEIINNDLYTYGEEIFLRIPEITRKVDKKGKEIYLFKKASGEEVNFEDLDEDTLSSLYRKVINEANLIRHERLNLQLQQLRQLDTRPPQIPTVPQPVTLPPQPPKVHTPPQVPKPPQVPPPSPQRK